MKKSQTKFVYAGIIIVALLIGYYGGFFDSFLQGTDIPIIPTIPDGDDDDVTTEVISAKAQWNIRDRLTKIATASGDTGYVSVCKADANGYFDLLVPSEETEFDAAPDTSAVTYTTGDKLLLAVSSDNDPTGGYETYPRWFYVESLKQGAIIYGLPVTNPISALQESSGGSGSYQYKVNKAACENCGTVSLLSGTTPYWDFGTFELYGRVAKDYIIQQITYSGSVGATLNDGATWEDSYSEINANFTFTSDTADMWFELIGEANDVAFGLPTLAVSTTGQAKQYNAVMIIALNSTAMQTQSLIDDGWVQMSVVGLTSDVAFYHVIDPTKGGIPGTGSTFSIKIPISIVDTGLGASTAYDINGWVLDWQNVNDVQRGSVTTSLPAANGFLTEFGSDTVVEPLAFTVSSNAAATPQLYTTWTTNA